MHRRAGRIPLLSAFVVQAHQTHDRHVFVPAVCGAAASAARPGLGEHVDALPAMEVVGLGYAAALALGQLLRQGLDWQLAHAVILGRPDPEWPTGRPVLTEFPRRMRDWAS